jgi:hypothetical protein
MEDVMPIHDWSRVKPNRFHDFHQSWTIRIKDSLNTGLLPDGFVAMAEQVRDGSIPDVVTLTGLNKTPPSRGGVALAERPLRTQFQLKSPAVRYAAKANRVAIRDFEGELVAIIEIVSHGNKDSRESLNSFTKKIKKYLQRGVHALIIDLHPPTRRDPQGIHNAIWHRLADDTIEYPAGKPLTLASYVGGEEFRAYIEPVGVGDTMPDMPIFLADENYIECPLEATYQQSWDAMPRILREPLEQPII